MKTFATPPARRPRTGRDFHAAGESPSRRSWREHGAVEGPIRQLVYLLRCNRTPCLWVPRRDVRETLEGHQLVVIQFGEDFAVKTFLIYMSSLRRMIARESS